MSKREYVVVYDTESSALVMRNSMVKIAVTDYKGYRVVGECRWADAEQVLADLNGDEQ